MNQTEEWSPFPGSHRLADLARRVPHAAWPFIVLAAAQTILVVGLGMGDFRNVAILIMPTLLPVAVLIGRRDAWNSARLIMIGVILWGSVGALVQVVGLGQDWFAPESGSGSLVHSSLLGLMPLASMTSIVGPALVAQGLYRRRRTQTTWPPALVAAALSVTAAFCLLQARAALDAYQALEPYRVDFGASAIGSPLSIVAEALGPLTLLTVGVLAWSTLSAFRANEEPRRFWLAVSAGSTIAFAAVLFAQLQSHIPTDLASVIWSATYQVQSVAILVGLALLLIGFGLGLPDSDEDLLGEVLPDESALSAVSPETVQPNA